MVTKRSETKSTLLQQTFPDLVSVHDDNQEILDQADIVFLCVLPEQASDVLQNLEFDSSRHQLVSMVSTSTLADLERDSKLPKDNVAKMICLPSVAFHTGVCLYCTPTPNPFLTQLFESLGGCVSLETEDQLEKCMISTCLQGPLFGIMRQNRDWLVETAGLSLEKATYLVSKQYQGMVQDVDRRPPTATRLDDLVAEQTPGGLNEQTLANLDTMGVLNAYGKAMDAVLSRVQGRSDGSLPTEE
uniref:Pyrroline-5-carboxylate reductase catalytic N-terminal domain-containing protein n=1 Tax=Cyclophora tenuis TaxID=216820 RepID=A0A7S1DC31_CYCTE